MPASEDTANGDRNLKVIKSRSLLDFSSNLLSEATDGDLRPMSSTDLSYLAKNIPATAEEVILTAEKYWTLSASGEKANSAASPMVRYRATGIIKNLF